MSTREREARGEGWEGGKRSDKRRNGERMKKLSQEARKTRCKNINA